MIVRTFFTWALVLSFIFPGHLYANLPEQTEPESGLTVPQIRLTSYAAAVAFAKTAIANAQRFAETNSLAPGTVIKAQLFHFEGEKLNPYFKWVLKYLNQAKVQVGAVRYPIEVEGTIVSRSTFESIIGQFDAAVPSREVIEAFQFSFSKATGLVSDASYDPISFWTRLKTSLQWFADKAFGAPYGLTFVTPFFRTAQIETEDGPRTFIGWRFGKDASVNATANKVAAIGLAWIVGVRVLGGWLMRPGVDLATRFTDLTALWKLAKAHVYTEKEGFNWEFVAVLAVVGGFVNVLLRFSREVDLFRRQGTTVKVDPKAAPGEQITIAAHDGGYLAACTTQECVLNGMILTTQSYFGTATFGVLALLGKVLNGALAAFSYLAMEEVRGGMLQESERLKTSDPAKAARLSKNAHKLGVIFWGIPFPIANNSAQFLTGIWSKVPLLVLGTGGFLVRMYRRISGRNSSGENLIGTPAGKPETSEVAALDCPDFLILRAVPR